ncbi:hypothetical protein, partial [Pseudomonas savastanoi]|uniref:hypothetical protein n=1 Tax=Pseudomonas savastanoi TaxID=29438 RepID=UPI001C82282C
KFLTVSASAIHHVEDGDQPVHVVDQALRLVRPSSHRVQLVNRVPGLFRRVQSVSRASVRYYQARPVSRASARYRQAWLVNRVFAR